MTSLDAAERLTDEWRDLLTQSGAVNPFTAPEWQIAWARHFTAPGELRLITVRHRESLVAVAPFFRRESRLGPFRLLARTRLLGRGSGDVTTELPQILCHPKWRRKALRAVVSHLTADSTEADWIELSLGPDQVWLEPEWLPSQESGGPRWVPVHTGVVATVVMPLPDTPDELSGLLKRNVTESIRRSKNRLRRADVPWRFEVTQGAGAELSEAVERLAQLHSMRAQAGGRFPHTDHFADPNQRAFLGEAASKMASAGHLEVCSLTVRGQAVASLLVLRANGAAFLSVSGMDPDWWDYGPMTLLQYECLRHLIADDIRFVNLSRGPNASKLRWSEQLDVHQQFMLVAARRRSHAMFSAYRPYRMLAEFRMRSRQPPASQAGRS